MSKETFTISLESGDSEIIKNIMKDKNIKTKVGAIKEALLSYKSNGKRKKELNIKITIDDNMEVKINEQKKD